jgi:hypothetical protein
MRLMQRSDLFCLRWLLALLPGSHVELYRSDVIPGAFLPNDKVHFYSRQPAGGGKNYECTGARFIDRGANRTPGTEQSVGKNLLGFGGQPPAKTLGSFW